MAKITLNSALHTIRGKIDNWVYRKYGDGVIIGRQPEFHGVASAAQVAVREQFRLAAVYARTALADPVQRAAYQAAARARQMPLFAYVMGDFLNPPEVQAIEATGYHGQPGDLIKVTASDDYEVAAVEVAIRNAANGVIEHGPAVPDASVWTYMATAVAATGATVTIEATATDRPGHTGSKAVPVVVG